MTDQSPIARAFDTEHAERYDRQFEGLGAVKDLLHLLLQVSFSDLPANARILVAGAGTGAEARFLASLSPGWRFTLVDPSPEMLAVAERHARAEDFAERCVFHEGYVASLPMEPHDAATSILVSHFLTDAPARQSYFEDIAARLKPGAPLLNADLSTDRDAESFERAMDLWLKMMRYAAAARGEDPSELKSDFREIFGTGVAAHDPAEVEALITNAGFTDHVPCYQALLIRAWFARRK